MFVLKIDCAILIWTVMSIFTYLSKTEAASINQKMLDSRELVSTNSVNVSRSHDGDIIVVKGKKKMS